MRWIGASLILALGLPAAAAPAAHLVEQDRILLQVRPLVATPEPIVLEIEIDDAAPSAERSTGLAWPDAARGSDLKVAAHLLPGAATIRRVRLEATLSRQGEPALRTVRELTVDETTTILVEVAREGDAVLTLAVEAERSRVQTYTRFPPVGSPVRFLVEVQRVDGDSSVSLETNRLSTFVGRPVSYSFRLGGPERPESARILLHPVELRGELLVLDVELEGTLPSEEGTDAVARQDRWITSRSATSSLEVISGKPASGYRFRITAEY